MRHREVLAEARAVAVKAAVKVAAAVVPCRAGTEVWWAGVDAAAAARGAERAVAEKAVARAAAGTEVVRAAVARVVAETAI